MPDKFWRLDCVCGVSWPIGLPCSFLVAEFVCGCASVESWVGWSSCVDGDEVVDGDGHRVTWIVLLAVVHRALADPAGFVVGCCDLFAALLGFVPGFLFDAGEVVA